MRSDPEADTLPAAGGQQPPFSVPGPPPVPSFGRAPASYDPDMRLGPGEVAVLEDDGDPD